MKDEWKRLWKKKILEGHTAVNITSKNERLFRLLEQPFHFSTTFRTHAQATIGIYHFKPLWGCSSIQNPHFVCVTWHQKTPCFSYISLKNLLRYTSIKRIRTITACKAIFEDLKDRLHT